MIRNPAEQAVVQSRVRFGNVGLRRIREPGSGNDHTVVKLLNGWRTSDKSCCWTYSDRQVRIVERGIKNDLVSPERMVRLDDRVSQASVDGQVLSDLPSVLRKHFVHVGAKNGEGAMAYLRIPIE